MNLNNLNFEVVVFYLFTLATRKTIKFAGAANDKSTCTAEKQRGTILWTKERNFKREHFTKFCIGLHKIFGFHWFNLSSFVSCFTVVEFIFF